MPFRSEDEGGARKTQSAALTARREKEDDNPFALSDADRDVVLVASKESPHSLFRKPAKNPANNHSTLGDETF